MKRSQFLNVLSIPVLLIAVGCGVLMTGPARADDDNRGALTNYKNPGYRTSSRSNQDRGGGYRPSRGDYRRSPGHYERELRLQERGRGMSAGQKAGWQAGYDAGYRGRTRSRTCTIDLSWESLPYQRGFREGFETAYERGFYAGEAAYRRERHHRYPIHSGFQIRIGF